MYYNIHTHKASNTTGVVEIISISPQDTINPQHLISIGIPPWEINDEMAENISWFQNLITKKGIVAIGEIGLDKRLDIPFEKQLNLLSKQIAIAKKNQKPLIFHCVGGFNELIQLKREKHILNACIIHGFRGKEELAKELVRHGFYLSIGEKSLLHRDAITTIPLSHLFIETDMSFCKIEDIYSTVALIKSVSVNELKKSIEQNFIQCFGNVF